MTRLPTAGKKPPWWRYHGWRLTMATGVVYTVVWSVLLYFGWTDSPAIILWCDVITGIFLLHLAYDLIRRGRHFTETSKWLRLVRLLSLVYASAWTVIIMFTFGAEVLLPVDLASLAVTLYLCRLLWRSPSAKREK